MKLGVVIDGKGHVYFQFEFVEEVSVEGGSYRSIDKCAGNRPVVMDKNLEDNGESTVRFSKDGGSHVRSTDADEISIWVGGRQVHGGIEPSGSKVSGGGPIGKEVSIRGATLVAVGPGEAFWPLFLPRRAAALAAMA